MRDKKRKKAQLKISFGMIFSIILIIAFMAFSFYAIKFILDLQKTAQLGKFIDDFEADVDNVWKSSQSSREKEYYIPGRIEYVCFTDLNSQIKGPYRDFYEDLILSDGRDLNMYFYPSKHAGELYAVEIKNLNLEKITSVHNPYCIEKKNDRVTLILKKEFGENLVVITEN